MPTEPTPRLRPELLATLAEEAEAAGLPRLGVVRLDHPGFAPAVRTLEHHVAEGRPGEMAFMERTLAVRSDPARMLPGARTLLVALVPYRGEAGPVARYAQSADYHTEVHRRLDRVQARLHEELPDVHSLVCVDTKPVLERSAAALAGLGFLGKHGCLIAPGLGSYVLLGELLCTAAWDGPDAVESLAGVRWDACGTCTRCLDACPTSAFVAPGELDPRRCISYLTIEHRGPIPPELADRMGERIAGCDVCQEVCPYNAGPAREARVPAQAWIDQPADGARVVDLLALATLRSGRHRAFVRDTALRRIPRRSLRRNALLALGNRPGPATAEEIAAAQALCDDEDPQIADAARRVLDRRGGDQRRRML